MKHGRSSQPAGLLTTVKDAAHDPNAAQLGLNSVSPADGPRIISTSNAPEDDPPPGGAPVHARSVPTLPGVDAIASSTWPIVIIYRDGGTMFVIPARSVGESTEARRELVVALIDRVGRVRSSRCTCRFFEGAGTCTHVWEASFELASQDRTATP